MQSGSFAMNWIEFENACRELSKKIGFTPDVIVAITRGGISLGMNKNIRIWAAISIMLILPDGCIPLPIPHRTDQTWVEGRLLDGDTTLPVRDCSLTVKAVDENECAEATPDDEGNFSAHSLGKLTYLAWLPLLPFDPKVQGPAGVLEARCPGFENIRVPFEASWGIGRVIHHLGDIRLRRAATTPGY